MVSHVTTSRGHSLNMDELIDAANTPLVKQPFSEIAPKPEAKKKPLNMRGHRPTMATAQPVVEVAPAVQAPAEKAPAASFTETGTGTTLADVTGVKIDKQKFTKGKAKGEVDPNNTLTDILTDLAASTKDTTGMKDEPLT